MRFKTVRWSIGGFLAALGCLTATVFGQYKVSPPLTYTGMADASGAVAMGTNFFAVANDEDQPIRVYRRDRGGAPVKVFDFSKFLELNPKKPEADFEAATRLGDRAFWIGSHGRSQFGKSRESRHRLFATDIQEADGALELTPVGKPYKRLVEDLIRAPQLARFNLAAAAEIEPKAFGALNLEGLCGTPDGQLLLGFRNPIPQGRALLVPLANPNDVIAGRPVRFGEPILLDLDGLGIRDFARWENRYLIIAGAYDAGGPFHLYQWAGDASPPQRLRGAHFPGMNPEAIILYPDKGLNEFQILSDDGTRMIKGVVNKTQPIGQQSFRSVWVKARQP